MRADDVIDQIDTCLGDYAVSGDAMRQAPDLPQQGGRVVIFSVDTSGASDRLSQMREGLTAWAEAVRPQLEAIGRSLAAAGEAVDRAAVHVDACKPVPPRDRPAWQSPYGPTRRRR